MRWPGAERVTLVHRNFAAEQWPEVHRPGQPGGQRMGELERKPCPQPNLSCRFLQSHAAQKSAAEHSHTTGLATGAANDETSGVQRHIRTEYLRRKYLRMNIGLFGGSFDPIHRGHLALARAAAERYSLRQVLFVPANVPPHKQKQPLTPFLHRYAMVALATQDDKRFVPSLLESPEFSSERAGTAANYSIDTVRRLKKTLKKADRLFFLIGIDAFRDIAKWREAHALLAECDFVIASRPGFSLRDVAESLPQELRPPAAVTRPFHKQPATGDLVLPGVTLHLLEGVNQNVSATVIRTAAAQGKPLARWLEPQVADYIKKHNLYQ